MTRRLASIAIAAALVPPTVAASVGAVYVLWVIDVARAHRQPEPLTRQLAADDALRNLPLVDACAWLATARDIDALPVVQR